MKKGEKKARAPVAREQGLMSSSHYFETLSDPFNHHGEKIPDDITYPSSTFSIVDRRVLTLSSTGFGSICYGMAGGGAATVYGSMVPCRMITALDSEQDTPTTKGKQEKATPKKKHGDGLMIVGDSKEPFSVKKVPIDNPDVILNQDFYVGMQTTGVTTAAGPTKVFPNMSSDATGIIPFKFDEWDDNVGVPTLYNKARLVSAGMTIDYLGTLLNAKGRITIASVPRRTLREKQNVGFITLLDIQNLVGAKIIPVNKLTGGSLEYHPVDSVDWHYTDQLSNYDATSNQNRDIDCALGNEFYMVVDSAEAAATCQVTTTFNFEAIPKLGTLNLVQPTFSRSDPIELAMNMNAIEKVPTAQVGNKALQRPSNGSSQMPDLASPQASKLVSTEEKREEKEEESFMTKVLDGAEGVLSKAPGIIGKATPLVRQALGFLGI